MADVPLIGPSYNLTSRPASVQRTVNLIPVPQEPGNERTAWVFMDAPGLVLVQDFVEDPDVLVIAFENATNKSFNGINVSGENFSSATALTETTYASQVSAGKIEITQTGTYEVAISYTLDSTKFGVDAVRIGSNIVKDVGSLDFVIYPVDLQSQIITLDSIDLVPETPVSRTDLYVLNVYQAPVTFFPKIFGDAYDSSPTFDADAVVVVRRSGDSIVTPP